MHSKTQMGSVTPLSRRLLPSSAATLPATPPPGACVNTSPDASDCARAADGKASADVHCYIRLPAPGAGASSDPRDLPPPAPTTIAGDHLVASVWQTAVRNRES